MNTTQQGIITLLKSAVTGQKQALPADFSLESAYGLLRKQHVLLAAYQGALRCGVRQDLPVMQLLLRQYYQLMIRSEKQMRAVEHLFQAFEEHHIDYMPLKGCNLKQLYPQPELRMMGDADILIHPGQHSAIIPVMEDLGFALESENEHVFNWRSSELLVELHKSMVPPDDADYYAYYGSGWHLAVKQSGSRHDLSQEDAFLFLFTHFARHYRLSGIGCRHVLDLYVYRQAFPDMDRRYIRKELEKLHLLTFYENILRMLDVWFADAPGDDVTELITAFIFSGGSWGTAEAGVFAQEVKSAHKQGRVRHSGIKAALRAIFPSRHFLTYRYAVLMKAPWLLPVIWVVRWFDILLFRPQNIGKKVRILKSVDDEKILTHQQALQAVGLE